MTEIIRGHETDMLTDGSDEYVRSWKLFKKFRSEGASREEAKREAEATTDQVTVFERWLHEMGKI